MVEHGAYGDGGESVEDEDNQTTFCESAHIVYIIFKEVIKFNI